MLLPRRIAQARLLRTATASIARLGIGQVLMLAAFVVGFTVVFWPTFVWMAERFNASDSYYSHGWIIPFAVGWLIWQRRQSLWRFAPQAPAPTGSSQASERVLVGGQADARGLWLLVPALLVHTAATWLHIGFISGGAMVAAIWGLVWTLWGWRTVTALRFPLLFLLFMVPVPSILLIATSFKMKLLAASWATHILSAAGMTVTQAGSTIYTPTINVIVDDTCSGLRSLISLIALSTLWTSLLPARAATWHRVTLVVASIPIALAANMVRILTLVVLSAIYGPSVAESFIHFGSGLVVFGFAVMALGWLSNVLVKPAALCVTRGSS